MLTADSEMAAASVGGVVLREERRSLTKLVEGLPVRHGFPPVAAQPRCVTVWRHVVVIGMHLPIVVVYNSKTGLVEKVPLETSVRMKFSSKKDGVSSVNLFGGQMRLAVGQQSGALHVIQLPQTPDKQRSSVKLNVHSCEVSCLEWDSRGSLLLSGDVEGQVVATYMDSKDGKRTSWAVYSAHACIVQLSYALMHLLVSTTEQSVICHIHQNLREKAPCRVGEKDRKPGPFGGCSLVDHQTSSSSWFVARPGLRIWKAQADGQVLTTVQFRDQVQTGNCPSITLLGLGTATSAPAGLGEEDGGVQFSKLLSLRSRFFVSWHEDYLWLLDPAAGVVAGLAKGHGIILDVCIDDCNVYVLRVPTHPKEPPIVSLQLDATAVLSASSTRLLSLAETCFKPEEGITATESKGTAANEAISHMEETSADGRHAVPDQDDHKGVVSSESPQLVSSSQPSAKEPEKAEASSTVSESVTQQTSETTACAKAAPVSHTTPPMLEVQTVKPVNTSSDNQPPTSTAPAPVAPASGGRFVNRLLGVVSSRSSSSDKVSPILNQPKPSSGDSHHTADQSHGTSRELLSQWIEGSVPSMEEEDSLVVMHDDRKKKPKKKKKKKGTEYGTEASEDASLKPSEGEPSTGDGGEESENASLKPPGREPVVVVGSEDGKKTGAEASSDPEQVDDEIAGLLEVDQSFAAMVERSITPTPMVANDVSDADAAVPVHTHIVPPSSTPALSLDVQESSTSHQSLTTDRKGLSPSPTSAVMPKSSLTIETAHDMDSHKQASRPVGVDGSEMSHPADALGIATESMLVNSPVPQESSAEANPSTNVDVDQASTDAVADSSVVADKSLGGRADRTSANAAQAVAASEQSSMLSPTLSARSSDDLPTADSSEQLPAASRHNVSEIACSSQHIWICDSFDYIYTWSFTQRKWVYVKGNVGSLSCGLAGDVVWGKGSSGNVKYRSGMSSHNPTGTDWMKLKIQAKCVAADDGCCWIFTKDGELLKREGVTGACPSGTRWLTRSDAEVRYDIDQLAAGHGVVWARTTSSRLLARVGISSNNPLGTKWQEEPNISACHVDVGPRGVVWCVNDDGVACFMRGVERNKPCGDGQWWQVALGLQVPTKDTSILSSFLDVPLSINTLWSKANTRRPDSLKFVAASEAGVCGVTTNSCMHLSSGPMIGSYYQPSSALGLSVTVHAVCAGAGSKNGGVIWLSQPNGEMFGIERGHRPVSVAPPQFEGGGQLVQIAASSLHVAVWVLDSNGFVYERSGLTEFCQLGLGWKTVNLRSMRGSRVKSISCGGYTIFLTDSRGNVWFRYACDMGPRSHEEWYHVNHPTGEKLAQVAVGPGDWNVWAIDGNGGVYVRVGITIELPGGAGWEAVDGVSATSLSISLTAVWVCCQNGDIVWRCGVTARNPGGDYWRRIPGSYAQISVTPSNQLWVVSSEGELFVRQTRIYRNQEEASLSQEGIEDAGWEVV